MIDDDCRRTVIDDILPLQTAIRSALLDPPTEGPYCRGVVRAAHAGRCAGLSADGQRLSRLLSDHLADVDRHACRNRVVVGNRVVATGAGTVDGRLDHTEHKPL